MAGIETDTLIFEELTEKGLISIKAGVGHQGATLLSVYQDGRLRGASTDRQRPDPSVGAVVSIGPVHLTAERGRRALDAIEAFRGANSAEIADELARHRRYLAAQGLKGTRRRPDPTGALADIEANYPGGLAAFERDEASDIDRTPRHKGEIDGY
jgi:hypothetical protein